MMQIQIDWSDVKRVMANLRAAEDQMPFAMSLALNEATKKTRLHLITDTWSPRHGIKVRNASFIRASLQVGTWANKRALTTEIVDKLNRGHLMMHAKGGTRSGRGRMAIPVTGNVPRTGRGVPKNLRPNALGPKLFKRDGRDALYVRDRRGRLKLMYVLKSATPIPKRVPFFEDYHASMSRELRRSIPIAVERAMRTRRAR